MTIRETIKQLEYQRAMFNFDPMTGDVGLKDKESREGYEACTLAIRSLEAWEKVKEEIGDMSILSSYQLKSGEPTTTLYEGLCRHDEVLHIISKYLSEVEDKDV